MAGTIQDKPKVIAWVDHDETAVHEVIRGIGTLPRIEKDRKALKEVFRLVPVVVATGDNLVCRARDRILHECGKTPDLVVVDLAFGPPDSGGVVEVGRELAIGLMKGMFPVPIGIYSRYPCPRQVKRYHLASDGLAVVLENVRSTYDNATLDDCLTGDQWSDLFDKIITKACERTTAMITIEPGNATVAPIIGAPDVAQKRGQTDIGIITVREDEFTAILERFGSRRTERGKRIYDVARVDTKRQFLLDVAIVRCPEQGQTMAQAVARDMIEDLDPAWLFLVGIAGGLPAADYSLGDVVLATRVNDFSVSAALEGKDTEFNVSGGPMHQDVENLLGHLPAFEDRISGWNHKPAIGRSMPNVVINQDSADVDYYGNEEWRKKVVASLSARFPAGARPRRPKYLARPLITSGSLVKDTDLAHEWQKVARQAAGVEMELGGVYMATRRGGSRDYRILAIRGVSDIVGYRRSSDWTAYACQSAAAFAHALILSGEIPRRASSDVSRINASQ